MMLMSKCVPMHAYRQMYVLAPMLGACDVVVCDRVAAVVMVVP